MTTSKHKQILEHLRTKGSITGAQAWELFHVYRLSSVIYRLRNSNWNIVTIMMEDKDNGQYAKYVLAEEQRI